MGVSVSTYVRRCRWAINVCVVLCCVHGVCTATCVNLLCITICVSKNRTAYFRYMHVTAGMEGYTVVLVMRLYDFLRNHLLKNHIIGRFHVTSFN